MRLYTYRERPDGDDSIGVGFGSDSLYVYFAPPTSKRFCSTILNLYSFA